MDSSNRRQVSLPSQAQNPMAGRNPMTTHGGSVNVRGSQAQAQVDRGPTGPASGLQRQQPLSSSVRAPLSRGDTPAVGHGARKENRVLPIGGPVQISHRGSVAAAELPQERERPNSLNAPNRSSLLRRQAEIDEEMAGIGGGDVPQQFYTHDHSNRNEVPRRHSKGQLAAVAGQGQAQHRLSGGHEPLGPRNSGDSQHGPSSGHSHGQAHHNAASRQHSQQAPQILVHQDSQRAASKKQKERERQHMEDEMLRRAREKQIQRIKREIRKEKRVMLTFSIISLFFGILWLIAVCISYWYFVYADEAQLAAVVKAYSTQMPPPAVRSGTGHGIGELIRGAVNATIAKGPPTAKPTKPAPAIVIDSNDLFVSSHVGLWRVCRTKRYLQTGNEKILCYWHDMFPTDEKLRVVQYTDRHIVDYQRTEASFAIISLMVMAMVVPAALYTLKNTKYIFKRLAAGLYALSSVTVLVVLEVTLTKIDHESTKPYLRPPKSTVSYGFCFYVGWLVFSMNLITAIVYLVYSRKRKGDKALDDDDEEQEIIGR